MIVISVSKRRYHHSSEVRQHEGLDGKTPAQSCGIEIKGDNKWITLIQNSTLQK